MKSTLLLGLLGLTLVLASCTPNTFATPPIQDRYHAGNHMMMHISSEEEFLVEMIPHHQEAVDTSRLVVNHTDNVELAELATDIISTQTQEIEMMRNWLDEKYDGGYEPTYQEMMGDLSSVSGTRRDVAYIQGMIMHHHMAIMMARHVLSVSPSPEVASFAQDIIRVQSDEINQLSRMLTQY